MESYGLRTLIIGELRTRSVKLNERGAVARFNCVIEKHKSPLSAWMGDGAWGCHACGVDGEPLEKLARHLGIDVPKSGGLTVEEYAEHKRFVLSKLTAWGVHTTDGKYGPLVAIPYRDADGKTLRTKHRHRNGTFWHDDGAGTHPYGLDMLAKHPGKSVILVEGESDCHAAWHHNVLAIGIPGATAWKSNWAPLFEGREVSVWQEPGDGGAKFVKAIAPDVPTARVIESGDVKDLAKLHADLGMGFKAALSARIANAFPIDRLPPTVIFDPLIGDVLDRLKARKLEPIDAVPTMLRSWNTHCRDAGGGEGLARGWHVTIGAKTGSGKSLIALNLAAAAVRASERVAFISLEMTQEQLANRFLAIMSGATIRELEQGKSFSGATWSHAATMLNQIYADTGGVLYVNRSQISKLDDVVACMKYEHEVHGCRYMVTDYLQLARATATSQKENDILHQMTLVSGAIRATARELNVVSVALSQFNRMTSANYKTPPTVEGLMGGSPIENDSDQVLLLDHSDYSRGDDFAITQLMLAKNRHGGTVDVPVKFDFRCLRMIEIDRPPEKKTKGKKPPATEEPPPPADAPGEAAEPSHVTDSDLSFPF